jgi:hypothetical protein
MQLQNDFDKEIKIAKSYELMQIFAGTWMSR